MILDNVKKRAEEKGMTIAELERLAGLSNGLIGKWKQCNPNIESVRNVANVLGCSIQDLLE